MDNIGTMRLQIHELVAQSLARPEPSDHSLKFGLARSVRLPYFAVCRKCAITLHSYRSQITTNRPSLAFVSRSLSSPQAIGALPESEDHASE